MDLEVDVMTTLLISDFKAKCIEVLNAVHDKGETVIVTRRGEPLAKIVPLQEPTSVPRRLGSLAGEASEQGDIVHTDFSQDWENA
jgi:prevent-host-death family protein